MIDIFIITTLILVSIFSQLYFKKYILNLQHTSIWGRTIIFLGRILRSLTYINHLTSVVDVGLIDDVLLVGKSTYSCSANTAFKRIDWGCWCSAVLLLLLLLQWGRCGCFCLIWYWALVQFNIYSTVKIHDVTFHRR